MAVTQVVPQVYAVSLGMVNVFLVDGEELTLIDTGMPGSAPAILEAVRSLGRRPEDLRHILLTHLHADHTGSARALKQATGALIHMHPTDALMFEEGRVMRAVRPAPGLLSQLAVRLVARRGETNRVEPDAVDSMLEEGQELAFACGLRVLHTPGHTAGHVSFLYPREGGLLVTGDACSNFLRLGHPVFYEDPAEGLRTLRRLATLGFHTAVFGHGRPLRDASAQFRKQWGVI